MRARRLSLAWCALLLVLAAGCAARREGQGVEPSPAQPQREQERPPTPAERTVTLFFGDRQAMHVVPEERRVAAGGVPLVRTLVEELVRGPDDPFLVPTIPGGTRLLSLEVRDGTATVNLSREVRENHPGGSAGEAMTLESLVFTLTELPEVRRVRVLVEGEAVDTLVGHADLTRPLERGPVRVSPVHLDRERQAWLQGLADAGREVWRRDPLEVARREGRMFGLRLSDGFRLRAVEEAPPRAGLRPGAGRATVEVAHEGEKYEIALVQPVRPGDRGIWAIESVRAVAR